MNLKEMSLTLKSILLKLFSGWFDNDSHSPRLGGASASNLVLSLPAHLVLRIKRSGWLTTVSLRACSGHMAARFTAQIKPCR